MNVEQARVVVGEVAAERGKKPRIPVTTGGAFRLGITALDRRDTDFEHLTVDQMGDLFEALAVLWRAQNAPALNGMAHGLKATLD